MHRTVTYRILNARKKDLARLDEVLEMCRHLYNAALQERRDAWRKQGQSISYFDQCRELKGLRTEDTAWKKLNAQMVRYSVLLRVREAFKGFFRRVRAGKKRPGFPRFKSKGRFDTLIFTDQGWKLKGNKLILRGIGWLRIRGKDREAKPIGLRLVRKADRWYAQVLLDIGEKPEVQPSKKGVGIDVGLKTFATLSNGKRIEHPRFLKQSLGRLAKANQRLARRKRGSNRRREAKRLLARTHLKISNQRKDFIHKATRQLVNAYDGFAIEDLKIQEMAQGPRFLRRGIMDSAWSLFFTTLAYKAEEAGAPVVKVNPKGTTQWCSNCGTIVRKGLGDRWHSCAACGLEMDRDENAAVNILQGAVGADGFAP